MKAVADTSSLVHPAKVPPFWDLLREMFEEILIPEAVFQEILSARRGKSNNNYYPRPDDDNDDVPVIMRAIEKEGWIKVRKNVRIIEPLPSYLGEGEKAAINLMLQEKLEWFLMDDKLARNVAVSLGLFPRYSVYLLPYCVGIGKLTKSRAFFLLDQLVDSGYYLKSRDYLAVRELIEYALTR